MKYSVVCIVLLLDLSPVVLIFFLESMLSLSMNFKIFNYIRFFVLLNHVWDMKSYLSLDDINKVLATTISIGNHILASAINDLHHE